LATRDPYDHSAFLSGREYCAKLKGQSFVALIYRPPLSFTSDELRLETYEP